MSSPESPSRRQLLRKIALAASVGAVASASSAPLRAAEDLPLISVDDPAAKAVKYVEDTTKVKESEGHRCDACGLYSGKDGAAQGGCQLFKGKAVKAAGWCNAWAPQM